MVEVNVLEAAITGAITLCFAALGSLVLWLTVGRSMIIKYAGRSLWSKIADLGEHPESEENVALARVLGTQVAYMMRSFEADLQTPEGREKYAPIFDFVYQFVTQSIYGTWGQIMKKLHEQGEEIGSGINVPGFDVGALPAGALKIADAVMPKKLKEAGVGVGDLIKLASMFGKFSGGNGGSSPDHYSAGHNGGKYGGQM